ncbi:uncharacterized protein [Littorina saxatilis]|uniref:Flavin-containing monooxygenase n=1 Tax=Littorina saxatilis TaxID=31220 RepID=A0AAN9BYB5_9CAEN
MSSIRVAVVGAGAAGLCAVKHLARKPQFSVQAFEQSKGVGGTWAYSERTGKDCNGLPIHSSMYKNLKTNLPKEVMAFPDYEFNNTLPSFVTHKQVLGYLEDYSTNFNLLQHIKFETSVVSIEPFKVATGKCRTGQGHMWQVTSAPVTNRSNTVTEEYDAVIICSGHYSTPLMPTIPGLKTFPGEVMHSHDYRHPEHFEGKTVLCLGAAASGMDISIDMSSYAEKVYLCHNKARLESRLPDNVHQKLGIESIDGKQVTLKDGEVVTPDCLLLCTGYQFDFPFLTPGCNICIEDERITPLFKHIVHTEFPTLSFIGITKIICPFQQFNVQLLFAISVLDGSLLLPSKESMDEDTESDYKRRLAEGLPHRYAHYMGKMQWEYSDELARMAGCVPVSKAVRTLFDSIHATRVKDLTGYKKLNYYLADYE